MVNLSINVVYLIDCSGSMGKQSGLKGLKRSKLEEVSICLRELLSRPGPSSLGNRIGICAFRQRNLAAPEILDLHHLQATGAPNLYDAALEKLTYFGADGGTPMNAALDHALEMLEGSTGDNTIILITDSSNTVGEDPRIAVYRALQQDVRIRAVALGKGSDRKLLERIAVKTGGTMTLVEDAKALRDALEWNGYSAALPSSVAPAAKASEQLRMALGRLESEYARDLVDSLEFVRRKTALKQSLHEIALQTKEVREKAERELSCLLMEKNAMMGRFSDIRRRYGSKEINRKAYLEQSAPLEDKLAALKDDITLRRAILELPSEEYVSML
jgi:uncharacterized protein YegL